MDYLKQYCIPLSGLNEGHYDYSFIVEDRFFEFFEDSTISRGSIQIGLVLHKNIGHFALEFNMNGFVITACDFCLDDLNIAIDEEFTVYVNFDERNVFPEDDVITISRNQEELDITQLLYDYINISMPFKHVHPIDKDGNKTCNPEMLEQIENYLVYEKQEEDSEEIGDPRWDTLKNLIKDK